MKKYCVFFAKHTLRLRGVKNIDKSMCDNMGTQTIFDIVTASDEAYALFVFMHIYKYWKEHKQESCAERTKKKKEGGFLCKERSGHRRTRMDAQSVVLVKKDWEYIKTY